MASDVNFELARPNACRMYDELIGGDHTLAVDRGPLDALLALNPGTPDVARENRNFMLRACRTLAAEYGARQFLDLGCSYPTAQSPNLHEMVRHIDSQARVAYVDIEQDVIEAWRSALDGAEGICAQRAAFEDAVGLVGDPTITQILDFSRPVVIVLTGVLPFVSDAANPWACLAQLRDALPAHWLVLSHALTPDEWPTGAEEVLSLYREQIQPMYPRAFREVSRFFDGYEMLDPGLVTTPAWRPDHAPDAEVLAYNRAVAGVGVRRE